MVKSEPTGWVGWVYFASVMMFVVGGMQLIAGVAALFQSDFYLTTQQGLLVLDYTQWGWVHILLGAGIIATSIAMASGKLWGRIIGTALVALNALANMAFLSAYPLWSIIAITVDVLVIYALTMHGDEVKV